MIFGMEITSFLGIVFLVAGFILVGIEITMPGFSWPGTIGIVCFVAAIFLFTKDFIKGLIISVIVAGVLIFLLAFLFNRLTKGKLKSPIVLKDATDAESGFTSSSSRVDMLGKTGVVLTDMRPVGKANFDGLQYEVMSENGFIKKGTKIVVTEVKFSKIIVRPVDEEAQPVKAAEPAPEGEQSSINQ